MGSCWSTIDMSWLNLLRVTPESTLLKKYSGALAELRSCKHQKGTVVVQKTYLSTVSKSNACRCLPDVGMKARK